MGHPRAAFAYRDFRLYQVARFLITLGIQVQSVAVAWQVYDTTGEVLDLGWVGLAHFLPMALLSLAGGQAADRYDRVHVLAASIGVVVLCALALAGFAWIGTGTLPIYAVIVVFGAARAFSGPAAGALVTHLVPEEHFGNAVAWNSTTWQVGTIIGPALGGGLYAVLGAPAGVYAASAVLSAVGLGYLLAIQVRPGGLQRGALTWDSVIDGVRYVRRTPLIYGAITLDLFAVLLGGAVALLPAFAQDVLHTGPWGLGLLRAAPAVGAAAMATALAIFPIERRAGHALFAGVALFGLATIGFALSESFLLSFVMLVIVGGSDMVSVVIRHTLVQLHTPAEMRGRVTAVNLVFIGASNELGEFESGLTAHLFGLVRAAALGGVGTIAIVLFWAWRFPALRTADRFDRPNGG